MATRSTRQLQRYRQTCFHLNHSFVLVLRGLPPVADPLDHYKALFQPLRPLTSLIVVDFGPDEVYLVFETTVDGERAQRVVREALAKGLPRSSAESGNNPFKWPTTRRFSHPRPRHRLWLDPALDPENGPSSAADDFLRSDPRLLTLWHEMVAHLDDPSSGYWSDPSFSSSPSQPDPLAMDVDPLPDTPRHVEEVSWALTETDEPARAARVGRAESEREEEQVAMEVEEVNELEEGEPPAAIEPEPTFSTPTKRPTSSSFAPDASPPPPPKRPLPRPSPPVLAGVPASAIASPPSPSLSFKPRSVASTVSFRLPPTLQKPAQLPRGGAFPPFDQAAGRVTDLARPHAKRTVSPFEPTQQRPQPGDPGSVASTSPTQPPPSLPPVPAGAGAPSPFPPPPSSTTARWLPLRQISPSPSPPPFNMFPSAETSFSAASRTNLEPLASTRVWGAPRAPSPPNEPIASSDNSLVAAEQTQQLPNAFAADKGSKFPDSREKYWVKVIGLSAPVSAPGDAAYAVTIHTKSRPFVHSPIQALWQIKFSTLIMYHAEEDAQTCIATRRGATFFAGPGKEKWLDYLYWTPDAPEENGKRAQVLFASKPRLPSSTPIQPIDVSHLSRAVYLRTGITPLASIMHTDLGEVTYRFQSVAEAVKVGESCASGITPYYSPASNHQLTISPATVFYSSLDDENHDWCRKMW